VTARDNKNNVAASQFLLHITESKSEKPAVAGTDASDDGTGQEDDAADQRDDTSGQGSGKTPSGPQPDPREEARLFYDTDVRHVRGRPSLAEQMVSLGHRKMERDLLGALQKTVSLYGKAA
jgi:hypothetical protein